MQKLISCSCCGKNYEDVFSIETNQAYGCSSDIVKQDDGLHIYCHYGSKFDTSKLEVKKELELNSGLICDECIEKMLKEDNLIEDKNYDCFDYIQDSWESVPDAVKEEFWKEPIYFGKNK